MPEKLKFLVVDDDLLQRECLRDALAFHYPGNEFALACNGVEGLNHFKSDISDIIITDCEMPEMNGLELTKALRQVVQQRPDITSPLIIMTTGRSGIQAAALEAGVDAFFAKPFSIKSLFSVVNKGLEVKTAAAPRSQLAVPESGASGQRHLRA